MSLNNPLFVPLTLHAFAVNQNTLQNKGANIQRWRFAYPFLNSYNSPMPKPFTGQNDFPATGVAVHWELPHALREGAPDASGNMQFPLVANRWLVVRYSGPIEDRRAVAWVVQSDALGNATPGTGGSPFIDPTAPTLKPTFVGQVVGLSNWSEPHPPNLFLTAVAPGNNMFASFQPYSQNVFSMFDPLDGVAVKDTLSYMVAGWYSDAAADFIGSWQIEGTSFEALLDKAGWALATASDDVATQGLYGGLAWGIEWDRDGPAQNGTPPAGQVQLAIGNTAVDALTALIDEQAGAAPDLDPELLEALQYGLLPAYDQPDAQFELKQQIEQGWFGAQGGGYRWEIADTPVNADQGDPPPPPTAVELAKEAQWLATLNQQQDDYDVALRVLADLQWDLYQTWWKAGFAQTNGLTAPYPAGTSAAQFAQALDAGDPTSLISRVHAQQQAVATLRASIPTGETQNALEAAIAAYAQAQSLPASRELKVTATRPFHQAYNPTLLMNGLGADSLLIPNARLACRFQDQLVTGFAYSGGTITLAQVEAAVPTPAGMANVPALLGNLLQEFFLIDPTNATMIAKTALGSSDPQTIAAIAAGQRDSAHYTGIAPDIDLDRWVQPWSPLVLMWDIVWYPIPHDANGTSLWTFDGDDYVWDGTGFDPSAPGLEYQGMIFLTPQASFNFRAQIEKFIAENPDYPGVAALDQFIEQIDGWDFLSQSLVGLTQQMALRDPAPNLSPASNAQTYFSDQSFASLIGASADYVPQPGAPQPQPFQPWPPSGFQNWRAGQFLVRRLFVVDRFGQTCEVVTSQTQAGFTPIVAPSLKPQHPVQTQGADRFVQLPPRLLQPARLDFDFVSCTDDDAVLGIDAGVNPICGWLLHNYLDESIIAYDNRGVALGALWVVTNARNAQIVYWQATPDSRYTTIADLLDTPDLVELGGMLGQIQTLGPDAFRALLITVDEAVWNIGGGETTADLGMTLLAGRPVALLRARLRFATAGAATADPSWRFSFAREPNPVTTWPFAIRLGEAGQSQDGLIGYFVGRDYATLHAPNTPEQNPAPNYIQPVGTGAALTLPFDGISTVNLTLLSDPRAVVHATTGVLPPVTIAVPQTFVDDALANMQVTFAIGPLLSDVMTPAEAVPDDPPAIVMPRPTLKAGTWQWRQYDGAAWDRFDVMPSVSTAQLSNVNPVLREGTLQLSGAIGGSARPTSSALPATLPPPRRR